MVATIFFSRQLQSAPLQQFIKALEEAGVVTTIIPVATVTPEAQSPSPPVASPSAQVVALEYAVVTRIIDGDTVELENGQKVRYIGINTPELHHPQKGVECFGLQSSEANKVLVEGKRVRLEKDVSETDRYGRLLRYVWLEDTLVNESLVKNGFAYASSYSPDIKNQDKFSDAEKTARAEKKGMWGECPN